jgi:hypothetical protein
MHTGGGKENRGIVVGQEGFTLDLGVAPGFKKFYVFKAKFIGRHDTVVPQSGPFAQSRETETPSP